MLYTVRENIYCYKITIYVIKTLHAKLQINLLHISISFIIAYLHIQIIFLSIVALCHHVKLKSWSTWLHVTACCLKAANHYPNQHWFMFDGILCA